MKPDPWQERLEAFLDHELDPTARDAFAAEAAADPEIAAALAARRRLREAARDALTVGVPADVTDLATAALRMGAAEPRAGADTAPDDCLDAPPAPRPHARLARAWPRRPRARWAVLGLAAVLALALLAPTLLRNLDGAAGRSTPVRSGQVVAVRFGEIPGGTVTLEAGCYDRSTGICH
jgi:anti-sigma factor RsiW